MLSESRHEGIDASDFFLDHARSSYSLCELEAATHAASSRNPACGDEVTLQLRIDQNTLQAAVFQHVGCSVSRAAASILCEHLHQRSVNELAALTPEKMLELLRIPISPARRRCVLLAWECLQAILQIDATSSSPESNDPQ